MMHGNTMTYVRHIGMVVDIAHHTAIDHRPLAAIITMMKMQTVPAGHLFFYGGAAHVFTRTQIPESDVLNILRNRRTDKDMRVTGGGTFNTHIAREVAHFGCPLVVDHRVRCCGRIQ
jgi:hypothetical protein